MKNHTLANLSHWPEHKVDALARWLKGLTPKLDLCEAFEITRSLPHGHVAAVLGTARALSIEQLIDPAPSRRRDLVCAMLVAQVIAPGSGLAFARGLRTETATSSLGQLLGVASCDQDDLYAAMDWALQRKETIENTLAARHLSNGTLVLYDVSSAAFEGRTCPLGPIGHPETGSSAGCGSSTGCCARRPASRSRSRCSRATPPTPTPWPPRSQSSRPGSGLPGCAWWAIGACSPTPASATSYARHSWTISARCAPRRSKHWSRKARCSCRCSIPRTSSRSPTPTTPGSGWCAAKTRPGRRTRPQTRRAVGGHRKDLEKIAAATRRPKRPLRGRDNIALRVGKVINYYKMAKHFSIEITDEAFTFTRNHEDIAAEAALDGIYVLRTSLPTDTLTDDDVVLW